MPSVTLDHVAKSFGSHEVLRDVSVTVGLGERVGLVGINGSGKSTLGRLLAGLEEPDRGTVARRRDLDVAYLSQEPRLDDAATVYHEVEQGLWRWREATRRYEAVSDLLAAGRGDAELLIEEQTELAAEIERFGGWDARHRIHAMLGHLGITSPRQVVGELSGGERRRVALARILVAAPGLAVLDEPTNHLDADTAEWLERYLREEFTGALVLITHDRYFLDRVVTRVLELDGGVVYAYEGSYGDYLEAKAERLAHEARTEVRRANLLRREREWLARGPKARSTKQKARILRAGELEEAQAAARPRVEAATLQAASVPLGKRILELRGLGKRYGDRVLIEDLDLILLPGERVGVIGRNGAGKSTLVRMVLGEETPSAGEVVVGKNTRIKSFDQGRTALRDEASVYDNLFQGSDEVRLGERRMDLRSYLENFLFDSAKQRQRVGSLSGGERARVALAKLLLGEANLLLLDEPTNDLDLATLGALEELLLEWPGCALVVTHDRYFLNRVATSILAFEGAGRVVHYPGDWDACHARRTQRAAEERAEAARVDAATARRETLRPPRGARPLTMAEARELEGLPGEIDAAEASLRTLEQTLNDPMLYADRPSSVATMLAEAERARARVESLLARWEELERRRAER